jgi:hypothetical protein
MMNCVRLLFSGGPSLLAILFALALASFPATAQTTNAPAAAATPAPAATPEPSPATTNTAVVPVAPANPTTDLAPPAPPLNIANGALPAQGPQEDIKDIRPPFFYPDYTQWAILVGAVLIALVLLWYWLSTRPARQARTAFDQTLDKLAKARALLNEANPMPYAVLVSETIRQYLGRRFQSPSTRRTTEEFLRLMEKDHTTPLAAHRDLLREFLQSCDLVKFARYQPTLGELEKVHERAVDFVTATRPVEPASPQRNGSHA